MSSFSIITATYNSLPTLKLAWESLCSQSFMDWEWVVVDGASTDGTKEWLSTIEDERIQWKSEKDKGIYDALNKGLGRANGTFIGFLHADDFFATKEILAQIHATLVSTNADGVYGPAPARLVLRQPRHPAARGVDGGGSGTRGGDHSTRQ